jgi:hypothetical protein
MRNQYVFTPPANPTFTPSKEAYMEWLAGEIATYENDLATDERVKMPLFVEMVEDWQNYLAYLKEMQTFFLAH